MKKPDVEEMLDNAARVPHSLPAGLLERIVDSVGASLQPVRPLPATRLLSGALVLIVTVIALLGAARAGFQGIAALSPVQRVAVFGALALLASLVARRAVGEWIPGSARPLGGSAILAGVSGVLFAVFMLLFRDYSATRFLAAGVNCLLTGLLHAAVAAPLVWWVLRRGYAVNPVSAGLVAGVLAGLAGVSMLELHCANLEAPHVLVWHTLVVPLSAAIGAIAGRVPGAHARSAARGSGRKSA